MNSEFRQSDSTEASSKYYVPWTIFDIWLGVVLLALIDVILLVITLQGKKAELAQSAAIVFLELAYLLPVVFIFAWRRYSWKYLGFRSFDPRAMALGCGLLVVGYGIILVHNYILLRLGIDTQGESVLRLMESLGSPVWFFLVGVVFAPFVEETFFRGFLFQGLRQKYGWISAALLSSAIFAAAHLDPVALIPTFILGCVLAFAYYRSNSIWPGIILHFLVNGTSLLVAYIYTQLPPDLLSRLWLVG